MLHVLKLYSTHKITNLFLKLKFVLQSKAITNNIKRQTGGYLLELSPQHLIIPHIYKHSLFL